MTEDKGLVLVTGITGYIGAWIARELLDNGYKVRGTVRDLTKKKGKEHLEKWKEAGEPIEIVEATLLDERIWDSVCKDVTYVMHVASPFVFGVKGKKNAEKKLYKPAKLGSLNVLKAAQRQGVKRVVLTSSIAAMVGGHPRESFKDKVPEEVWTDINSRHVPDPYYVSKTIAEKSAWEFVNQEKEKGNDIFEFVTVCPSLVLGPPISTGSATSHDLIKLFLNFEVPVFPNVTSHSVDVRDVAKVHRLAIEKEEVAGERYLLFYNSDTSIKKLVKTLKQEFSQYGYRIPTIQAPYFALWLYSFIHPITRGTISEVGKPIYPLSNEKVKNAFNIEFIPEEKMIIDHAYACLDLPIKGFKIKKKYERAKEEGRLATRNS